MSHTYAS